MGGQDEPRARAMLIAMQERLARDPYAALGVSPAATASEIRAAFLELTKIYHPARFGYMSAGLQRLSNEVFLLLRAAHDAVARPARAAAAARTDRSGVLPRSDRSGVFPRSDRSGVFPAVAAPPTSDRSGVFPAVAAPPRSDRSSGAVPAMPTPKSDRSSGALPAMPTPKSDRSSGAVPAMPTPKSDRSSGALPAITTPRSDRSSGAIPAITTPSSDRSGPVRVAQPPRPSSPPPAPPPPPPPRPGAVRPTNAPPLSVARPEDRELAGVLEQLQRGQWAAARAALSALAARTPNVPRYLALLSYARGREAQLAHRLDEARVELQAALQLDPDLQLAKTALAELFTRRK